MGRILLVLSLFLGFFMAKGQDNKSFYIFPEVDPVKLESSDRQLLDSLLPLYHTEKNDTQKIRWLGMIVEQCVDENVWPLYNNLMMQEAKAAGNRSDLSEKEKEFFASKLADAINNKGFEFLNVGNTDSAAYYFEKSIHAHKNYKFYPGMASAYTNAGYTYKLKGDVSRALEYYLKGLEYFQKANDKEGQANSENNIGLLYKHQGETDMALAYYQKSLKTMREVGNKPAEAACLSNIGFIYNDQGRYEEALKYFSDALAIDQQTQNKINIASSLNNTGSALVKLNRTDEAKAYFEQSLLLNRELGYPKGISETLDNLASVEFRAGNLQTAIKYSEESYKLASSIGYPENIRVSAGLLSELYEKTGNWKQALDLHKVHILMRDSIFNETTRKSTFRQQMKFEYEKKEALAEAEHQKILAVERAEKKKKEILSLAIGGGLIVVLIFSVFLFSRYRVTRRQKLIIEKQKEEVNQAYDKLTEKNREVVDSIRYARRIQSALLKEEEHVSHDLPEHFVLFKPKDIVSGDFYWSTIKNNWWYVAAADCTGHGVPGAFLTMLGTAFLNEIISSSDSPQPAEVLNLLRDRFVHELSQASDDSDPMNSLVKDGMDISLARIHLQKGDIEWAGANNPLWIGRKISDDEVPEAFNREYDNFHFRQVVADKQPIGYYPNPRPFTNHRLTLQAGDYVYLFTDGYADQFGGPRGKKFKYRQLEELLSSIHDLPMNEQKKKLNEAIEQWRGDLEQIDDITVIGIKFGSFARTQKGCVQEKSRHSEKV